VDKLGRKFHEKPKANQMNVFNRSFKFGNSNSETHASDLYKIIQSYSYQQRPKILGLICDNGPDFNPGSILVFYSLGQLWKKQKLDQLIVCSYAPRSSKYNQIEIVWGTLSQALAQLTLVSDYKKYDHKNNENGLKALFIQAQDELKAIWDSTMYNGKLVRCNNVEPSSEEDLYQTYRETKEVFKHGKNHSNHEAYKTEMKMLLAHCTKKAYCLHFTKCKTPECSHCQENPIQDMSAFEFLDKFENQLPTPVLLKDYYLGQNYPSLMDLASDEALRGVYNQEIKKTVDNNKKESKQCLKCNWYFESKADSQKHKRYCSK